MPLDMPSLLKPPSDTLRRFLAEQANLTWSYAEVGATAGVPPPGYVVDRTRVRLGSGKTDFDAACAGLRSWRQFQLGWVEPWPAETPLRVGETIAVLGRAFGLWWTNCCRIVYTVDEYDPLRRFGFAYGTLPAHAESGEERFLVEWDHATDEVSYDIVAFSRPNKLSSRIGYPLLRRLQKRFGRDSATAMFRAVNADAQLPEILQETT